ncbi:FAD/FMN-containing dehydrogenase [Arsukibacterium tuosuense]|uniref:FAD/FMN-containing dehydrogenase n=1 Tax=Arsukibacterium tuosuense TaxID=1323745 RepID=A0A285IUI0_9GAMM|nr:FAD-binding protein [Arsukibacterium tuosuense]SNY51669.1 FAD/FMN-containing dehydrogenase [Arsukibacterium tuosuense]
MTTAPEKPDSATIANLLKQKLSTNSQILLTAAELAPYQLNCEGATAQAKLVVRIGTIRDIAAVLELASAHQTTKVPFSVHPISTGRNWGYASARANEPNAVILDLSRLNNISCDDETLGIFTVEPGVTQQDLRDYLNQKKLKFMVPVTGAGPSCSILGNALERGYGITPYTDHFAAVNSIRGLLADGTAFRSAVAELDKSGNDFIDKTYKYGLGPYLDGLWTQSNLAVVTEISLRLKAEPEAFSAFYLQFASEHQFEQAQQLVFTILQKLEGVVGSVNIMDQRRVTAMMAPNPNGPAAHQVMTDQQVVTLAEDYDIPAWTIAGTLYGQKSVVKAAKAEVKRFAAGQCSKMIFSDSWLINIGRKVMQLLPSGLLRKQRKMLSSLDGGIEIMRGYPNQIALPLAYWRNPAIQPAKERALNPAADGCGLLWYAPLVPMRSEAMRRFIGHVRAVCPKYGIEPMITFTSLKHDMVDSTIPIVFNLADPAAVTQAHACLEELVSAGLTQGWVPYRLNLAQQANLLEPGTSFWQISSKIKQALDPDNIISPGRYQPRPLSAKVQLPEA